MLAGGLARKRIQLQRLCPEHVKIVDFSQQILEVFKIFDPGIVQVGKKVLDNVAEALDGDAQVVQGHLAASTQGRRLQMACLGPALQRDVLEDWDGGPDACSTLR